MNFFPRIEYSCKRGFVTQDSIILNTFCNKIHHGIKQNIEYTYFGVALIIQVKVTIVGVNQQLIFQ
jgi:hypothetical protein